jgi:hypothetical protein
MTETWRVLTLRLVAEGATASTISIQANAMLNHLLPVMRLVSVARLPATLPPSPLGDPNDALVWATAIVADAQFVVSHNTRHFPDLVDDTAIIGGRQCRRQRHLARGVESLTAIEFIEDVLGADATGVFGTSLPERGVIRSRRSVTPL